MTPDFVHLRFHSDHTLSDGLARIDPMLDLAAGHGQPALGISDLMNVFAAPRFYDHALSRGVKPLLGCDLWLSGAAGRDELSRATVYCRDHDGYLSLCRLLSRAWLENQCPVGAAVRLEWLAPDDCRGLLCLSGGPLGLIERALSRGEREAADRCTDWLLAAFPDSLYLEVQRAGRPDDERLVSLMANHAARRGLPLVATHPIQFLRPDDFATHEVRVCIQTGRVMTDPGRPHDFTARQYCLSPKEMGELFADLPVALSNTMVVAERCNLDGIMREPQLPRFPVPAGLTPAKHLTNLSLAGLERRLNFLYPDQREREQVMPRYRQRLDYELQIIISRKFDGYFLIVQDFINWSRRNGVPVGPGRGSGAGSLVAYCLGITDLDPLHYNLLFERFLNPERKSMPDFDIDFCQFNRERTIEYVKRLYGAEAVSQIAAFGTLGARAAIRDVGRALGMGYGEVDDLARLVPKDLGVTLASAAERDPDFVRMASLPRYEELMVHARALEGCLRNITIHAAGVLIAPGRLTDFCPLYNADGKPESTVSQFDKGDVESSGLVKFDFLGLKTISMLTKMVEYIDRLRPGRRFRLEDVPMTDRATMDLFRRGDTQAVFQFESPGMRHQLLRVKPDRMEDLVAINALFRPGPMEQIGHFVDRKFGREPIEYPDPRMEPILSETYGIMVYQEQVMLVAQAIGGYSLGSADLLRRAMGKKKVEEMRKQRAVFVSGAAQRGVSAEKAGEIFDLMEKFAGYGFNKSHAAAYSCLAWQMAYIKVHYPACFYAGVLDLSLDREDDTRRLIHEARSRGLTVLPPDINASDWFYAVPDEDIIRFGLGAIKGMSQNAAEELVMERRLRGPYEDLFDIPRRLPDLSRRTLELLVKSGALDSLCPERGLAFANIDQALRAAASLRMAADQGSLFAAAGGQDDSVKIWKKADPWSDRTRVEEEISCLGLCLSGNPLARCRAELDAFTTPYDQLRDSSELVRVAGIIADKRTFVGKMGKVYALNIEDGDQQLEVSLFDEVYNRYRDLLAERELVVLTGKYQRWSRGGESEDSGDSYRFQVSEALSLEQVRVRRRMALDVTVSHEVDLTALAALLRERGAPARAGEEVPCQLTTRAGTSSGRVRLALKVRPSDELRDLLLAQPGILDAAYRPSAAAA